MKFESQNLLIEKSLSIENSNKMKEEKTKFPSESQSDDNDDPEDAYRVIDEGRNGRWNKLDLEIPVQKIQDFDSSNLGIDTEKGVEIAWNEMKFSSNPKKSHPNRFESIETLRNIFEKLKKVLEFMLKLDHSNILKFFDYWFIENQGEAKLVVITEYSTGGSLKKYLDNSRKSQTKVKPQASRRFLNQILYTIKFIHSEKISIFHGHINSETIFIQNNGVIKLTPALLSLNGVFVRANNLIRVCSIPNGDLNHILQLTNEIKIKDLNAVGKLAEEIFNIHLKAKSPMSPLMKSKVFDNIAILNENSDLDYDFYDYDDNTTLNLNSEQDLEKSFVKICLNSGRLQNDSSSGSELNFNHIWYHPFINNIYSLKVLSVYSLLSYFQEKKMADYKNNTDTNKINNCSHKTNNTNYNNNNNNNIGSQINKIRRKSYCSDKEDVNESPKPQFLILSNISNERKQEASLNQPSINASLNDLSNVNRRRSSNYMNHGSNNNSQISLRINSSGHLNKEKRKVSLTFLTNYNYLTIPQNFFSILEDIKSGLYPRLFKERHNKEIKHFQPGFCLKSTTNSAYDYLEFFKQTKQLLEFRSMSSLNLVSSDVNNANNLLKPWSNDRNNSNTNSNQDLTLSDSNSNLSNAKSNDETRRLTNLFCKLNIDYATKRVDLNLDLEFNDTFKRNLECSFESDFLNGFEIKNCNHDFDLNNLVSADEHPLDFKIENICIHLANELIDFGLINKEDRATISETILKTMKDYLLTL